MIENLADLARYIRENLPRSIKLEELRVDESADAVLFRWEKREYIVKRYLKVFEVKYNRIYITGYSLLVQSALTAEFRNEKVIEAVMETINQAQNLINEKNKTKSGLELLKAIKATLVKLTGKPRPKRPKPPEANAAAGESVSLQLAPGGEKKA